MLVHACTVGGVKRRLTELHSEPGTDFIGAWRRLQVRRPALNYTQRLVNEDCSFQLDLYT
jgi:hypothetical protein